LAHIAIGSVTEKVLRAAPCPVLIVRPDREGNVDAQAIKVLREEFGHSLAGELSETRLTLKERLMGSLNITDQAADSLVELLRTENLLTWEERQQQDASELRIGSWHIAPAELANEEAFADLHSRDEVTPAIDLIGRALKLRATDIHIDPSGAEYAVRFRIDGRLERYCQLDATVAEHLIHQYRTNARLDIADPFHPQEGRLRLPPALSNVEARITTSPVTGGESVALRLFERDSVFRSLDRLGLSELSLFTVDHMLQHGEGLVLVTGPTGSGKTTTVYSMLMTLSGGDRNIVSIEDPVEFPAPFVRQMQVDPRHGVTMTIGLRTLLRMDPDIVFLGEIRDAEAAEIAMRAASSGKYVFSTLHTRDVASTVTALLDLGVDRRSLAGNLTGIISQRLVRRLCPNCRRARDLPDDARKLFDQYGVGAPDQLYEPIGCSDCRGNGYRGRIGVFEAVLADAELVRQVAEGAPEHEIRQQIRHRGISELTGNALVKVADGLTSIEEATRMTWV
jgi:type II secretory ATPase GspE/PulE/Tfp pilus assembly ATPase PilB-like protein